MLGLAAYNGGPSRIARLARDNPRLSEDELFESIPLFETRDYVAGSCSTRIRTRSCIRRSVYQDPCGTTRIEQPICRSAYG